MELVAHLRLSKQALIDLAFFRGVPIVLAMLSAVLGPYAAIMGDAGATVYVLLLAIVPWCRRTGRKIRAVSVCQPVRRRTGAAWLPIQGGAYMSAPDGATWRSGYATVCKTVYTSSILVVASIHRLDIAYLKYSRVVPLRNFIAMVKSTERRQVWKSLAAGLLVTVATLAGLEILLRI